jgi:hypothetical protein
MAPRKPPQARMPTEGEARDLAKQLRYVESRSGGTRTEARQSERGGRSDSRAWRSGGGRSSRRD